MSTATAKAYQPRFAGRFVPFEMPKSPQNKAFYGHRTTYSGKAHCIKDSVLLDAACGSGGFLVKAMSLMIQESGGEGTAEAKQIKKSRLYGIEFDREIFALACANMLIHKDGKTNLTQMDSRSAEACEWIASKKITKVLMNPPFETKYGCLTIVKNVLDNVPVHTECAFILPDKKLEKDSSRGKAIIKEHSLKKIIKLPSETFNEGVSTSIFVFEAGVPQGDKEIFTCWLKKDGLETVKNQGRQDIKNRWPAIEAKWLDIIEKQSGDSSIAWVKPAEHLSFQEPEKPFEIHEEDFLKTMMDYEMFKRGIDAKKLAENVQNAVLYADSISEDKDTIKIVLPKGDK